MQNPSMKISKMGESADKCQNIKGIIRLRKIVPYDEANKKAPIATYKVVVQKQSAPILRKKGAPAAVVKSCDAPQKISPAICLEQKPRVSAALPFPAQSITCFM